MKLYPKLIWILTNREKDFGRDRSYHSPINMFKRHHLKTQKTSSRYSFHRLRHDLKRTLWHAFDSLSNESGNVHRSQLKVLAASIGRPLGVEKCEEFLDKNESIDLDYPEFYAILDEKLFEPLARSPSETVQIGDNDFEEVHHVCWTLCCSKRISRRQPDKSLSDEVLYKLWRIFNFLAECDDLFKPTYPLRMDKEEVKLIVQAFLSASGQMKMDSVVRSIEDHGNYSYSQFESLFEKEITKDLSDKILHDAIDTIYDEYINDTLVKGMIYKRGHQVKSWKVRWMVLTAGELSYYTASDMKDIKGCIKFDNDCKVEILSEEAGHKPNRFVLHTASKPYEMSASDINTRNEWVAALRSAIEHCDDDSFHFHQNDFIRRQEKREQQRKQNEKEEKLKQEEAENIRRMQEEFHHKHREDTQRLQEQMEQLERERKEREALEAKLREEAALRELDQQRLRELEAMKTELERLLEEEKQAKRDEEIVRALQARILEEETEKREELEKLKEQQEELLKMERQKREGLEGQREQQESLLQQARERLQELENKRKEADEKLEEAHIKLQDAEKERIKLQDKVKLWKTPNIGLARPVQPKLDRLITHRGKGAFCDGDFVKHQIVEEDDNSSKEYQNPTQLDRPTSNDKPSTSVDKEETCANKEPNEYESQQDLRTTEQDKETQVSEDTSGKDNVQNHKSNTYVENNYNVECDVQSPAQNSGNESKENVNRLSEDMNLYENAKPGIDSDMTENNENVDSTDTTNMNSNVKENVNRHSDGSELYENIKSDSTENGGNVTVNTQNMTAFDNMIYETVELKIVESSD